MSLRGIEVYQPVSNNQCRIWPECAAKKVSDIWNNPGAFEVLDSPRAGGSYRISDLATEWCTTHGDEESQRIKARLTTQLLNAKIQGNPAPMVTHDTIQLATISAPLPANERAERLLRHLVESNPDVAFSTPLVGDLHRPYAERLPLSYSAMAWSESTTWHEVEYLLDYLRGQRFVTFNKHDVGIDVTVSVQGHTHIAKQSAGANSSQAFVAMWFDDTMDAVYHHAIAPAIQAAGYEPYRIDRDNFLNKIDDEIIAQIRRSKFILADFTHNPEGSVRGSVYYEAGFAYGLGTPCVFTARDDADLHFDTRQFPHILWKPNDLNALKHELTYRILALPELGHGPKAPPNP